MTIKKRLIKDAFVVSSMAKKIIAIIKLQIEAGKANPAPPIGSALGQRQVNIMEFCKQFNDRTKDYPKNTPLPTLITVYEDKSFSFIVHKPTMTFYVKKLANFSSRAKNPGREEAIAVVKKADVLKLIEEKVCDLNCFGNIESAFRMFAGSAKSMGVKVVE